MYTSQDSDLVQSQDYIVINRIVTSLNERGIVNRGSGYCLGMSDMIKVLLAENDIDSYITECKLTVFGEDPAKNFLLIGHEGNSENSLIDTHVVCITKTVIPMLIDLSIAFVSPKIPYIVERLNGTRTNEIARYYFKDTAWVYQVREHQRLPKEHQISMLDRISTDVNVRNDIQILKKMVYIAITLGIIDLLANLINFFNN